MSKIFQEAPPEVIIHPLPRNAKYITARFEDTLCLAAWMPKDIYKVVERSRQSSDSFFEEYCSECERNCYEYLEEYRDEDGEVDWDEVGPHCDVYNEGYYGQDCPLGYSKQVQEYQFDVCEMTFEIYLKYRVSTSRDSDSIQYERNSRYTRMADSAYLCGSKVNETENVIQMTETYLPSNVFGYDDEPGAICWGVIEPPKTLRGIESNFFATKFNNDLTRIHKFYENSNEVNRRSNFDSTHHMILINNEGAEHKMDTLVIVDAEKHINAFFTLLCAGFKPQSEAPHVMLIPAREVELHREGMTFNGYLTQPDDLGKEWFISQDNRLVGQV